MTPRDKKTKFKWKEPRTWSDEDIEIHFSDDANVGIALGPRSGDLTDIDFDWLEAAEIADDLLSDLPSFGRESSRRSHRLAITKLSKNKIAFQITPKAAKRLGVSRTTVLEIRGDKHMTMFPPSVHPSGETVTWDDSPDQIPEVDGPDLERRCALVAFLAVILMFYPRTPGDRDGICLALTGALLQHGVDDPDADRMVSLVARLASDEEAEKRGGKAAATRKRMESGEPVWGLPELCSRVEIGDLEPTLRKWLGGSPELGEQSNKPVILVRAGYIPEEVDQAETALLDADVGIYQRGDALVRVVRLAASIGDEGVNRPIGALVLKPVLSTWLREQMSKAARWGRPTEDGMTRINPPMSHAATYIARVGDWRAPVLTGVIASPTMRADGTILQDPGYDLRSGLLFDSGGFTFPRVAEEPTRGEAIEALQVLARPFREFAFATRADRSVLLSAVLTALIRRTLPAAPMFAVDAPTASSGKSLLTETVGIIATGHKPTMMSQGKSTEEDEKRLVTVLMAGDAVVVIDNCERQIGGDTLCSMLTQEYIAARILGKNELARVPTNTLLMATGNNLTFGVDVARRVLICRLDTGEERPDLIEYDFDPRDEALADRPELVAAGLTVLRAYIAAGRPTPLVKLGSFEKWNLVRETLVWLGEADPAETRERIIADDPRKGELVDLLRIWVDVLGSDPVFLSEFSQIGDNPSESKLGAIKNELVARTRFPTFNARSVGHYLMKHKDQVVGGLALRCEDDPSSGTKRYRVESISMPKHGQDGEEPSTPDIPF